MGIYTRYKKDPNGFRKLVELLEVTPKDKRERMIELGRAEDAAYTEKALKFVMTFQDILSLSDSELAEVLAIAPHRMVAAAFSAAGPEVQHKVLSLSPRKMMADIKDLIEAQYKPTEIGGAQFKMIETARDLERRGKIQLKRIET